MSAICGEGRAAPRQASPDSKVDEMVLALPNADKICVNNVDSHIRKGTGDAGSSTKSRMHAQILVAELTFAKSSCVSMNSLFSEDQDNGLVQHFAGSPATICDNASAWMWISCSICLSWTENSCCLQRRGR